MVARGLRSVGALAWGFVFAIAWFVPCASLAVDDDFDRREPVQITADHLEYQAPSELFVAEGRVRIVSGDRSIDADWVAVARGSQRGVASGHVIYRDGGEELHSEFLQFDVETLRGLIYQGRIDTGEGGFLVDADQLIRTGEDEYTVRVGTFTTCRCPEGEPDWQIDAAEADVEIGGYATAQNTTIDILGVPVVWLPWIIFPVKTERETGVLFPEFEISGNSGFEVGLPLFWAARKNVNVTATPTYMTKRGYQQNIEVEYVLGKKSEGEVFAAYGRDEKRADSEYRELPGDENRVHRWTVLAEHDQHLPGDWRAKLDLHLISDNRYAKDHRQLSDFRNDAFLESKLFAFRHFGGDGRLGVVGSAIYAEDLQEADSRDRDRYMHQQAPSVRGHWLAGEGSPIPGLVTRMEFDYTHFYSDRLAQTEFRNKYPTSPFETVGDDLFLDVGVNSRPFDPAESGLTESSGEGDGIFSEGEPLADRGHRFVLHPRIGYPLRLFDRFELYPEVGYRQTLYRTHAQDFAEQGHVTARVELETRLAGRIEALGLDHVVEPFVAWTLVSNASNSGDPLLVPAAAASQHRLRGFERDNLLADPSDRVNSRNTFTSGVGNRFYLGGRLLAEFDIAIDHHLMGDGTRYSVTSRDDDYSRVVVAGHTKRFHGVSSEFHLSYDPDEGEIEEGLFGITLVPWSFIALHANYRYRAPTPANTFRYAAEISEEHPWDEETNALSQVRPLGTLLIGSNLRLRYSANYDLEEDQLLRQQATLEIRSKCNCWAVGIDYTDQRNGEFRILPRFSILGLGDDRLSADSSWGASLMDAL
ncbi:MAG: LPS-assembly protein LptD [bacterium]|nr:LPS-assembly protein LptD [bacterium]MCP5041493.1 LPS-assembly protein LptD [bacterium]